MKFEWSWRKSRLNKKKHGVSFREAKKIWKNTNCWIATRSEAGEEREATVGWIGQKLYVAIWTKRGNKIRLISVRRARKNEEKIFRENVQDN